MYSLCSQWSDTGTLDLLKSISLDAEIPSLLLVGAYREDEVTESHPLAQPPESRSQRQLTEPRYGSVGVVPVDELCAPVYVE